MAQPSILRPELARSRTVNAHVRAALQPQLAYEPATTRQLQAQTSVSGASETAMLIVAGVGAAIAAVLVGRRLGLGRSRR